MRRRTLPLVLIALLAASGCVTVSGSGVGDGKPPAARTSPGTPPAAWPLTRLPASSAPAPVPAAAGPKETTPDSGGQRPELRREPESGRPAAERRSEHPPPRAGSVPKREPRPKAKPKAEPKRHAPATKPAAPRRGGPAPAPGRIDMTELCRSSQGVTSPAITRLCHGSYGR
ncbi:hypothetical protein ACFXB3_09385 [Streptomyces sp. NPDC059447]|uniref:hypothetical protein n=1 Tax=Streptomyces sp. NPDC059447 TaxID=3346834 RepID=UPI0036A72FFE